MPVHNRHDTKINNQTKISDALFNNIINITKVLHNYSTKKTTVKII